MNPHPLQVEREMRGWSPARVAEAVGTTPETVLRWEQGHLLPSAYYRERLCALFARSAGELGLLEEADEVSAAGKRFSVPPQGSPVLDPWLPVLPGDAGTLVGREPLLAQVKQHLWEGGPFSLTALYGLPGMGKTALAAALTTDETLRERFRDGILWAGLGPNANMLSHLARWASLLSISAAEVERVSDPASWMRTLRAAIGQRRLLLVIDDAWQIEEALALQVGGAQCAHLLTTRLPQVAFAFAREGAFSVAELAEEEGVALLGQVVPPLLERDREEALALVQAVGGSPLALSLMGHYVAAQAFTGQPRRVQAALERLRDARARLEVHQPQPSADRFPGLPSGIPLSLQSAIAVSAQRLSEQARAALSALALFPPKPNSFSEEAALAVSGASAETLDELWDAGVLESRGAGRYTLHQTIADYARAQPPGMAARQQFVTYLGWYLQTHAHDEAALDREQPTILAALEVAYEQGLWPALVEGVLIVAPVLLPRGGYALAETHLQRALEAARLTGDTLGQATAGLHLGKIAGLRGQYAQAEALCQQGLQLASEHEHRNCAARLMGELGALAAQQGQLPEAHRWLSEALDQLWQLGDQRGVAETLQRLGNLASQQGQSEQANHLFEEALATFRRLGDRRGSALTQQDLAVRAMKEGRPEQARQLYEEALALLRGLGDRRNTALVLSNLGYLARQQGEPEQARQFLEEALSLARQVENRRVLLFTLVHLGSLATEQEHLEQAQQCLDEALSLARELQMKLGNGAALQALGVLAGKQGGYEQARQLLEEALALFRELLNPREEALTLRDLGNLARQQRHPEQAEPLYTKALTGLARLGDGHEVAITRAELGHLARQQGRVEEAKALLQGALSTLRPTRDRQHVALTLRELGLLQLQQGHWEPALRALLEAGVGLALVHSPETSRVEEQLKQLRAHLGEQAFQATVSRTAAAPPEPAYGLEQAVWSRAILAFSPLSPEAAVTGAAPQALPAAAPATSAPPERAEVPASPDVLTAREVEVLRLLAQGWSDAQIAARLIISPRTVNRHAASIYSKIGVSSRAAATRYALEHHLA